VQNDIKAKEYIYFFGETDTETNKTYQVLHDQGVPCYRLHDSDQAAGVIAAIADDHSQA